MQPATATGALQQLQQFQAGAKSPDQMLQDAQSQLGVNAAQQQVQGLRGAITQTSNLLNQVAPSVMGRTQNSLVTSAQANREIGNEQQPIQQNLSRLNTDYGNANQDYSNLEGEANQRATLGLTDQQNQRSYLQQIYGDLSAQEQAQKDEAFRQAQLAEQARQANLQAATSRANAAVSASPSFSNPSTSRTLNGSQSRNSVGGYSFSNAQGQPVTMAQFLAANGVSTASQIAQTAAQLLSQGSPGDKQIAQAITSGQYSPGELASRFPQVFGGSF